MLSRIWAELACTDSDPTGRGQLLKGSFSELVLEEYDKMNIDPLLGTRNSVDVKNRRASPSSPAGILLSPNAGYRSDVQLDSPKSPKDQNNDLVYPYKPPTEKRKNLLEIEDSMYKDSKNMSLDLHHSGMRDDQQKSIEMINLDINERSSRPQNKDKLIRLNQNDFEKPVINQFYSEQQPARISQRNKPQKRPSGNP